MQFTETQKKKNVEASTACVFVRHEVFSGHCVFILFSPCLSSSSSLAEDPPPSGLFTSLRYN